MPSTAVICCCSRVRDAGVAGTEVSCTGGRKHMHVGSWVALSLLRLLPALSLFAYWRTPYGDKFCLSRILQFQNSNGLMLIIEHTS